MWFKNLQVFRFTKPFVLKAQELSDLLAKHEFVPCGSQDLSRYGWVRPLGEQGTEFVHSANGFTMICAKKQEKVLPASVINEKLAEKVLEIQKAEDRAIGRKERQSIKEELTIDLLPKAFTRSILQFAYIAHSDGLIVINSSSSNRAVELLDYLRETIGSLPVIPIMSKNTPQSVMTRWLESGHIAKEFELGHECELRDPSDEGGVIRCKHQVLTSPEIINHIKSGMYVSKLGLISENGIDFLIDDELAIKRLVFDDIIQEKANQVDVQDSVEQFDVDFAIMTLEISALIKSLFNVFGGEKKADSEVVSHTIKKSNATIEADSKLHVEDVEMA